MDKYFEKITIPSLEQWVKLCPKCYICDYGIFEGGPGYIGFDRCELKDRHPDVRYGGKCVSHDEDCKDFVEASESRKQHHYNAYYE